VNQQESMALSEPVGMEAGIMDLLQTGGPVVVILFVLSVAALAIVIAKLWQFRTARLGDRAQPRDALRLWQGGARAKALTVLRRTENPVAQVLERAMAGLQRGAPEVTVREDAFRYGGDLLEDLRAWFRPLEVIASLSPLLGLFGTVLGMIEAFQQLEAAGNQVNPAILSGGIWVALLTTAVGLAVAIPAVALLNWLERRVDRVAHEMDSALIRLFTEDGPRDYEERDVVAGRRAIDAAPAE